VGLISFALNLPGAPAWRALLDRLRTAGVPLEGGERENGLYALIYDPDRNGIELTSL
jgi:hypothetical protein